MKLTRDIIELVASLKENKRNKTAIFLESSLMPVVVTIVYLTIQILPLEYKRLVLDDMIALHNSSTLLCSMISNDLVIWSFFVELHTLISFVVAGAIGQRLHQSLSNKTVKIESEEEWKLYESLSKFLMPFEMQCFDIDNLGKTLNNFYIC